MPRQQGVGIKSFEYEVRGKKRSGMRGQDVKTRELYQKVVKKERTKPKFAPFL
jgi:hypothetical protein